MPQYTIELAYHKETEETYRVTVGADSKEEAQRAVQDYLDDYGFSEPHALVRHCVGALACRYEEGDDGDSYAVIESVEPLPDIPHPNQLPLL